MSFGKFKKYFRVKFLICPNSVCSQSYVDDLTLAISTREKLLTVSTAMIFELLKLTIFLQSAFLVVPQKSHIICIIYTIRQI